MALSDRTRARVYVCVCVKPNNRVTEMFENKIAKIAKIPNFKPQMLYTTEKKNTSKAYARCMTFKAENPVGVLAGCQ